MTVYDGFRLWASEQAEDFFGVDRETHIQLSAPVAYIHRYGQRWEVQKSPFLPFESMEEPGKTIDWVLVRDMNLALVSEAKWKELESLCTVKVERIG